MTTLFLLLRVTVGLMGTAAILILIVIVLLRSGGAALKEGVGAIGYVAKLFASGFTEGKSPPASSGWVVGLPQAGLALLFAAMIVSTFMPEARPFLHVIAAMSGVAVIWYVRMLRREAKLELLCVPMLAAWLFYYGVCVFGSSHPPASPPEAVPSQTSDR